VSLDECRSKNVCANAHHSVRTLLSAGDFWEIEPEKNAGNRPDCGEGRQNTVVEGFQVKGAHADPGDPCMKLRPVLGQISAGSTDTGADL
jgi:hypothetical protein